MPEWGVDLRINFWSQDYSDAVDEAQSMSELLFTRDDVNSVEAPYTPIFIKGDE